MPIYLYLDIGSLLIPFVFSFHPRLRFDKEWKHVFKGILFSLIVYIIWDIFFTKAGIWGFNPDYLIGLDILGLPIEEWLFFICIPYACVFTHHCLGVILPKWRLNANSVMTIGLLLVVVWSVLALLFFDRAYTLVNFSWAAVLMLFILFKSPEVLERFFVSFLFIIIPFLAVNGVLTGSFIAEPIVWYNDFENLGYRIFTIPVEDFTYAFTMLVLPLIVIHRSKH